MSRVLCITKEGHWYGEGKIVPGPEWGETCIVIGETGYADKTGYILEGYALDVGYDKREFIPISDKDEMEYADSVLEEIFVPVLKPEDIL